MISVAKKEDIGILKKLNIPYNYKNTIDIELDELNSEKFRWIIYKENGKIIAFHRSIIHKGWGFLAGIFITDKNSDPWLLNKIINYSINDLLNCGCIGLIAWDDIPISSKTPILKRFGFNEYPYPVFRFIFDIKGINTLKASYNQNQAYWRFSNLSDYPYIQKLLTAESSFIDSLQIESVDCEEGWVVLQEEEIVAALSWSLHGNVLEIFFSLSCQEGLDIMGGILFLVSQVIENHKIDFLRINLEHSRRITHIRLMSYQPKTYQNGYKNTCLVKKDYH